MTRVFRDGRSTTWQFWKPDAPEGTPICYGDQVAIGNCYRDFGYASGSFMQVGPTLGMWMC